jgi:adenine-specific DNA methylase
MIPKECKRLAEVDFPIAVVSRHAAREKSLRHGHPSTLHLWWARRPLAACRAMLLGLLLPDPCDPLCPPDFKAQTRQHFGRPPQLVKVGPTDKDLRQALLTFIGNFANWDLSADPGYLEAARGLVKAAHPEETPLVVDPFAGGGSIPLEALRLGCDAFASDLNPVACLILKVLLEDIPRHGPELAEELRRVGKEVKKAAEEELAEFYPPEPNGARPIAYLWARTVRCEAPNCGAEIPLVRSFWLSKKSSRRRALRAKVVRTKGGTPAVDFDIFEPATDADVRGGTVSRAKATCLSCNTVLGPDRVRAQLAAQRGGADVIFDDKGNRTGGARLLTVVTLKSDEQGRQFRLPAARDYQAAWRARRRLEEIAATTSAGGFSPVPDEPLPPVGTLGFRVQRYGMLQWGDLFTARQKAGLVVFSRLLRAENGPSTSILATLISRLANGSSSLCRWNPNPSGYAEKIEATFSRQALPITWDFAETSMLFGTSGDWSGGVEWLATAASHVAAGVKVHGQALVADATASPLPSEGASCWFTDPPYYDAIPYSDLSDFFLVWLKRTLPGLSVLSDPFDPKNPLSPKLQEAVQDETKMVNGRPKDRDFFEEMMAKSFTEGRRILRDDGVGSVVFAHKTTEGWEALLSGMIRGGWTITGSWPISTEMAARLRARDSAALATSVHLVCRPRAEDVAVGDWAEVIRELPRRVREWMKRLQGEGIRGADLVFACIGPALEIYSRHKEVRDAEDHVIPLGGDPEARERRAQLPAECTAVDTAATEKKAREYLQKRFEDCYPFHPATISVFQRKWQTLSQYQQTRGTLAMLAQWISWAFREGFTGARREPLITLGSAPLHVPEFRSVVLGQIGESRLVAGIDADIAGGHSHARALDADTKGPLRDIHRRVGATILFESSGGQSDKVAHLPELRFALGEPEVDTTSIDNAALALEAKAYYIRKVGSDGFRIFHTPTLKKVVSDRKASLDADTEVKPTMRNVAKKDFEKGASLSVLPFPADGTAVADTPKLTLVLMDPEVEWTGGGPLREQVAEWTKRRGGSDRLHPGALVWCFRRPGRDYKEKVENWLAWKRVSDELTSGILGGEFDRSEKADVQRRVADAEEDARDEVWASYRYAVLADNGEPDGLKVIDLGSGHSSANETLCGRVISALKSEGLLNESVGANYIDRNWPPALKESGAWPLKGLRQSFLNGALTRLPDPDMILKRKVVEFVEKADFGLACGANPDGTYQRVWYDETVSGDEVSFDTDVFLLTKKKAQALKAKRGSTPETETASVTITTESVPTGSTGVTVVEEEKIESGSTAVPQAVTIRLTGDVPSEVWNRLGTKLLPKLKTGENLRLGIEFTVSVNPATAAGLEADLRQALADLGIKERVHVERA